MRTLDLCRLRLKYRENFDTQMYVFKSFCNIFYHGKAVFEVSGTIFIQARLERARQEHAHTLPTFISIRELMRNSKEHYARNQVE